MLTRRQKQALDFIAAELGRTGGVAPSYREIAQGLGMRSVSQARLLVQRLQERGAVVVHPVRWRALEIVQGNAREPQSVPRGPLCLWLRFDEARKELDFHGIATGG